MSDKETNQNTQVPFLVYDSTVARFERTIEKLWILCIIVIVLLIGTNAFWIYYENQFEDITVTQEVDNDEGNTNVSGIGGISNGESEADSTD